MSSISGETLGAGSAAMADGARGDWDMKPNEVESTGRYLRKICSAVGPGAKSSPGSDVSSASENSSPSRMPARAR